jgi:hypothetical protein
LVLAALMGIAASWGLASIAGGSSSFTDLRGTYTGGACVGGTLADCEANPQYPHTTTISTEDFNSGAISGSGFTGQITGCTVTIHDLPDSNGYTADETETISADANTLEGTFNDSYGRVNQPIFDKRTSGGPSTCPPESTTTTSTSTSDTTSTTTSASSTTTTTTTTSSLHATATQVICNYDFATSSNTCGASVGDADASGGAPTRPTGIVRFTGPADGTFNSGSTCTLTLQPSAPSVGFCSIIFSAPDGSLPTITATYGGDAQHSASSGHTKFFAADPSDSTTDTPGQAQDGKYPNEVDLSTIVPADGTQVDACATSTSTTATVHARRALARPHGLLGSISQAISADIGSSNTLKTKLTGLTQKSAATLGQSLSAGLDQSVNSQLGQALADLAAGQGALQSGELGPSEAAQLQKQITQEQQLLDQISGLLKSINTQACSATKAMHTTRALTARRRTAGAKHVFVLARIHRQRVAAGRLTIHLRLNRSAVRRASGTRKTLTTVLRITMIVPSKVLKPGRVIVVTKTLKLRQGRRRGKGTG